MTGRSAGPYGETSPKLVLNLEDWTRQAACSSLEDISIFFPERGQNKEGNEAKRICVSCPVRKPCLDYAVRNNQDIGIWGGLNEKERRYINKAKRIAICPGCKLVRLFFEKGAVKCDRCSGITKRKRLSLVSSVTPSSQMQSLCDEDQIR